MKSKVILFLLITITNINVIKSNANFLNLF